MLGAPRSAVPQAEVAAPGGEPAALTPHSTTEPRGQAPGPFPSFPTGHNALGGQIPAHGNRQGALHGSSFSLGLRMYVFLQGVFVWVVTWFWNDFLGETSGHGVKLFTWKAAVFCKARGCCCYVNLIQLNYVIRLMHLTGSDRLFSNFINHPENIIIDKKLNPAHST